MKILMSYFLGSINLELFLLSIFSAVKSNNWIFPMRMLTRNRMGCCERVYAFVPIWAIIKSDAVLVLVMCGDDFPVFITESKSREWKCDNGGVCCATRRRRERIPYLQWKRVVDWKRVGSQFLFTYSKLKLILF